MEQKNILDPLIKDFSILLSNGIELYKLKIIHKSTLASTFLAYRLLLAAIAFLFLVFLSLASALFIGNYYHNLPLGLLVVALIFLVFLFIVMLSKTKTCTVIANYLFKAFTN